MNKPRLIDANEALNIIRNGWSNHYSCKDMCDEINNIPTAYDIDKVVEQLEHDLEDLSGLELMTGRFGDGYEWATRRHIEIVKGGVE